MSQRIAIIGPGLLGTSIALAARRAGKLSIAIWSRRKEIIEELRQRRVGDLVAEELSVVVDKANVVVLCVPIGVMPKLAREIAPHLRPDALVTDVGSVKAPVVAELSAIFRQRVRFIGSHPMAGSEKNGHDAASADLFDDRVCIITPDDTTAPEALNEATAFWQMLGCQVRILSPTEHDEVVGLVSHLPHLLAATLVNTVAAQNPAAFDFHGPGFSSTTRVAGGPPVMWTEILCTNRTAVRSSAEAMIEKLREIITLLDRETTMNDFLTQAKDLRDRLRSTKEDV